MTELPQQNGVIEGARIAPIYPPLRSVGSERPGFAAAIADFAASVHEGEVELDTLDIIVHGAVDIIPGADCAAVIILTEQGRLEARAIQGPLHPNVIAMQNDLQQGPTLDATAATEQIRVGDTYTERRWPEFSARAAAAGIGSMLCTPLSAGGKTYGTLSLLSTLPHSFTAESDGLAAIFATHATIALAGCEHRRNLSAALTSRDIIGQAKGILIERHRLTPDGAFALLVKASQQSHCKLRVVAEELCLTGELPATASP
jgi:GAF domain-containing protein